MYLFGSRVSGYILSVSLLISNKHVLLTRPIVFDSFDHKSFENLKSL